MNEDLVKWLSRTAQGFLAPLAAAVGGVASQEVLKAVTGKFSPLQQWVRLSLLLDLYFDTDVMNVWLCVNEV